MAVWHQDHAVSRGGLRNRLPRPAILPGNNNRMVIKAIPSHPMTAPRRRWFRFTLRTLFVVMAVLCIALGIVLHRARARREALRVIDELGGGYSIIIDGPAWLRSIVKDDKYFYDIGRISFTNTPERPFTDE